MYTPLSLDRDRRIKSLLLHVFASATASCALTGCWVDPMPVYEVDSQSAIDIPDYFLRGKGRELGSDSGYFYLRKQPSPVFRLDRSDQSNGRVSLLVLNQQLVGRPGPPTDPFVVLCSTARLVIGNQKLSPQKVDRLAVQRIASCHERETVGGKDQLVGVKIEFQSETPLPETFSLDLPQADFGSGPMDPVSVTFSRRMVLPRSSGGFN